MKKGEIWLVEIPKTNGHEQSGLRPVIVFSSVEANTVFILPCTTNLTALRFMHTLEIHPLTANGLSSTSVALVFQLRAIDNKRLIRKIGVLEPDTLSQINEMIKGMLTLE